MRSRDDDHGLRLPESTALVEACSDGSRLKSVSDCDLYLPQSLREKHLLAIGGTGSGKTTRLILPQLYHDVCDPERTVIALDAKGGVLYEFLTRLAGRHRPGQTVHQVNMMRPERNTIVWNPVSSIRTRADAIEVAHVICTSVDAGKDIKDPFWVNSSIALLSDILLAMALDPDPDLERSIAAARQIADGYPRELAVFADEHPKGAPYPEEGFPAIYRALEGAGSVTQQSVVADLAQRLVMYGNENIRECTGARSQLDLDVLLTDGAFLCWKSSSRTAISSCRLPT